jgi:hypothetical protein
MAVSTPSFSLPGVSFAARPLGYAVLAMHLTPCDRAPVQLALAEAAAQNSVKDKRQDAPARLLRVGTS